MLQYSFDIYNTATLRYCIVKSAYDPYGSGQLSYSEDSAFTNVWALYAHYYY